MFYNITQTVDTIKKNVGEKKDYRCPDRQRGWFSTSSQQMCEIFLEHY